MKEIKGRKLHIKAYAVGDDEGIFIVPAQCGEGDIEPYAIFRLKSDAEDFLRDFKEWEGARIFPISDIKRSIKILTASKEEWV